MLAAFTLYLHQLFAITRPEVTQVLSLCYDRLLDIIVSAATEISLVDLGDDFAIKPEPSLAAYAQ